MQKENVMGHFSKKAIACRFARDLGFDYAHRDGLFAKRKRYGTL
nr:MAG TPA: hypothetical protein [Caudoviricetes sp.]